MSVKPFALERFQSEWEHRVRFNLSESGVRPLSVRELLGDRAAVDALLDAPLIYTQTNGTVGLRERIGALYPGATAAHVQVTNGGSEANFITAWHLVQPGDEVVVLVPTYMQVAGLVGAFGGTVREWPMVLDRAAGRWRPDLDALDRLVTPATRAVVLCTPNTPPGARLTASALDAVAAAAARHGAWVLSDEIYRGAERDGIESPTMWGRGERVVVTSGLSKAYGLPGLRVGWAVGPPDLIESLWARHDYTSIAPGALSDQLATAALTPDRRARLLARTQSILRENLPRVEGWLADCGHPFDWIAPEAGAFVFARYSHPMNSTALVTQLRDEESVLIVPGDHFGMDGYLRFGAGEQADYVLAGLDRFKAFLDRQATVPAR
ncbi:MAG TPA: aminotransferase class I/II-fold pyridoxal phosphate-dependent enzyme [Vicinamibacterales bacterium]|nr:aminotransferase class I/II-fold pyridoxal phosphate-dependent enzyme [Vicinamibacterales bacterium]